MGNTITRDKINKTNNEQEEKQTEVGKLFHEILIKYGELVDKSILTYTRQIIDAYAENKPLPHGNIPDVYQLFNQTCKKDAVILFERRLKKFPLWAIREQGMFGSSLKTVPFDLQNDEAAKPRKKQVCQTLANLFLNIIQLIHYNIQQLVVCRSFISFILQKDVADNTKIKSNKTYFNKTNNMQKFYKKQVVKINKLFKKINTIERLDIIQIEKLVVQMTKQRKEMESFPEQCDKMFKEINNLQIIDSATLSLCQTKNIPIIQCSKNAIASVNLQQQQKRQTISSSMNMNTNI